MNKTYLLGTLLLLACSLPGKSLNKKAGNGPRLVNRSPAIIGPAENIVQVFSSNKLLNSGEK